MQMPSLMGSIFIYLFVYLLQVCSITHLTTTQGLKSSFIPQEEFGIPIPTEKLLKLWFEHTQRSMK